MSDNELELDELGPADSPLEPPTDDGEKTASDLAPIFDVPVSISAIQGEKRDVLGSAGDDIRFLSARVPTDTSERLHALASAQGLSISEYLSRLIEESLDHGIVEGSDETEGEERR